LATTSTLIRSPYYRDKNKVHLDQIVIRIINDPAARAASLRSHDIDVAPIASTELQSVTHDPSLRVIKSVSLGYQGISINIGKQERNRETVRERRHDAREVGRSAPGVRARARPQSHQPRGVRGVNKPSCSPFPTRTRMPSRAKAVPCHLTAELRLRRRRLTGPGAKRRGRAHAHRTTTIAARLGALVQSLEKPVGFNVIPEQPSPRRG
jgi:peptide/nickel transport system substrate-binding protein